MTTRDLPPLRPAALSERPARHDVALVYFLRFLTLTPPPEGQGLAVISAMYLSR